MKYSAETVDNQRLKLENRIIVKLGLKLQMLSEYVTNDTNPHTTLECSEVECGSIRGECGEIMYTMTM